MCRCGVQFGKHGRSYSAQCDTPCPGQQDGSGASPEAMDQVCGGLDHQLIYDLDGKLVLAEIQIIARFT